MTLLVRRAVRLAQENDRVLLISGKGKRYFVTLRAGDRFHTNVGSISHNDLIGKPYGRVVRSHIGHPFVLLRPSLYDELMGLKRVSQIIYPKELGLILFHLDVRCGSRVIEAGTGSGALTMALANAVMPYGRVYSYESREEMLRVARRNLEEVGLEEYVEFHERDIAEGFDETDVDAVFLDVREPWDYLPQVCQALMDGGFFGTLVPTTNQVSALLYELERYPFYDTRVMEVLLREYKPVPGRLRPQDVMVGHTGYLIFSRKVASDAELPAPEEGSED